MKKHLLYLVVIVCMICSCLFLQWKFTVESLVTAFGSSGDEVQYASAMSVVEAIDRGTIANTFTSASADLLGEGWGAKESYGAPVDFPGVVIPNPTNIKPLTDTEALPPTRLAYGARFSRKSYAGHREGSIESCTQMWPDVQQREQ